MKKLIAIILACLTLLLTSCGGRGFNYIMRDHLSDIDNYTEYECIYKGVEEGYYNLELAVSFSETPKDDLACGIYFSEEYQADVTFIEIIDANEMILIENGFFEDVQTNSEITIKASPFIYMDTNFYFVISVQVGDTVYLNEETGLQNMIEIMKKNKSLL